MTIRKIWLIVLILISILSIGINSLILSFLTDKYFKEYLSETYNEHINQILEYTKTTLKNDEISYKQMEMELQVHLIDPIIEIKIYDANGNEIIDVFDNHYVSENMMSSMMERRFNSIFSHNAVDEIKKYEIINNGELLGIMNITLHSAAEESFVAKKFKFSLFSNSIYSAFIASILVILIGLIVSKKMSTSLIDTAKMASEIQLGINKNIKKTNIREINSIRESLKELDTRLKLKQKSRKKLVDELMHQTRTPLTILKSHIEAIEDGVVSANDEELNICLEQIESITSIISNLSGMIDANKEVEFLKIEEVEISYLLKQIVSGLIPQFNKKQIKIEILSNENIKIKTDKYKLSQAIFNILTNAYKYTKVAGSVTIIYKIVDSNFIIEIKDTGVGISENEQKNIFQAYYRGSNSTSISGDGIGLYIVFENINSIKGNVKVESKVGKGSKFIISLPVDV